ncbi:MAG: hypothetical protein ABEI58_01730 [Candidatus Nanohaloarchaea archaeon]
MASSAEDAGTDIIQTAQEVSIEDLLEDFSSAEELRGEALDSTVLEPVRVPETPPGIFDSELYSGNGDEVVEQLGPQDIALAMQEWGDRQGLHRLNGMGYALYQETGMMEGVNPDALVFPGAGFVYEGIRQAPGEVEYFESGFDSPADSTHAVGLETDVENGKARFAGARGEEELFEAELELGEPGENSYRAYVAAGVLGSHPQNGNILMAMEGSFGTPEPGIVEVESREVLERNEFPERGYSIGTYRYSLEDDSWIELTLLELDADTFRDVAENYAG